MIFDKRWTLGDRYGKDIYLTEGRWQHITDPENHPENHPEMMDYEDSLQEVIRSSRRKQDPLNLQKYRYSQEFLDLPEYNTHIVAIVLFRFSLGANGQLISNNYIVTAYLKSVF